MGYRVSNKRARLLKYWCNQNWCFPLSEICWREPAFFHFCIIQRPAFTRPELLYRVPKWGPSKIKRIGPLKQPLKWVREGLMLKGKVKRFSTQTVLYKNLFTILSKVDLIPKHVEIQWNITDIGWIVKKRETET